MTRRINRRHFAQNTAAIAGTGFWLASHADAYNAAKGEVINHAGATNFFACTPREGWEL